MNILMTRNQFWLLLKENQCHYVNFTLKPTCIYLERKLICAVGASARTVTTPLTHHHDELSRATE